MKSLFCCPICGGELDRSPTVYRCENGHSFDVAKEHYVNLLPPNRQHAKSPGDDSAMTKARTRFLDGGWYEPLCDKLCKLIMDAPGKTLLDAGCGEGFYTAAFAQVMGSRGGETGGVDLSKPAVRRAGKRCVGAEIAVASVYHLPVADSRVDILVDCFSPLAAEEFGRVLRPGGAFFYVVPGPRHLWEMKEVLYEKPYENPEKRECYPGFVYKDVVRVETSFTLTDPEDIWALFQMTPYAWKTPKEGISRLKELNTLTLTGQFHIHWMEKG